MTVRCSNEVILGSGVPHLNYNKISKKHFFKLYFLKILNCKTLHVINI